MRRLPTLLLLIAALLALGWSRWQSARPAAAPVSAQMPMSAAPESALPDLPPAATLRLPAPETLASTLVAARSLLETGTISAERAWMFVGDSVGPERVPEYQRDYADLLRRCGNLAMPSASAFYEAIRSWTRRAAELG